MSGFRWSFYDVSDIGVEISFGATLAFLVVCLLAVRWMLKTGWRLKT